MKKSDAVFGTRITEQRPRDEPFLSSRRLTFRLPSCSAGLYDLQQGRSGHVSTLVRSRCQSSAAPGRAYPHRIPLAKLKCVSEKRVRELAGRLRKSREASDRDYNPLCPLPTSS
jgi:hypothetical protein